MHKRFSFGLAMAAATLFSLSSPAIASGAPILIGQAVDLSGPNASIGRDYVAGIKTCFDMVNATGGVNGRRIQFIVRDDQGQAEQAAIAVSELIERENVDFLFGGVGDEQTRAITNAPAFRRSGHTLYAPLANAEYESGSRVLFWRPGYKQEIRHIFTHFGSIGINDVGVVYQESAANQDAYRSLTSEIQQRKMRLTGTARISSGDNRIAQEAERLAATRPGFIVVIADTIHAGLFLKEYRKRDAGTFVAGTSLINLETLQELAGAKSMEWTVFSQVVPNPGSGTSPLQIEHLNMMRKFRDEAVSSMTLEGFAAAKSLIRAMQQSKSADRSVLQDFMAQGRSADLGGLRIGALRGTPGSANRLSAYLDIALFRKGSGLMF
jgi:ABC-type branched-subunit amino acid transport system substrate-binding protein